MTSQVFPIPPPSPKISREEMAKLVAARRSQRRIVLPDTEECVDARREPLRKLGFKIRAKFEGPEVRHALRLGWRTNTDW